MLNYDMPVHALGRQLARARARASLSAARASDRDSARRIQVMVIMIYRDPDTTNSYYILNIIYILWVAC